MGFAGDRRSQGRDSVFAAALLSWARDWAGLGCLGRAGWGRARRWCFPTRSPPWSRLGASFWGAPVLVSAHHPIQWVSLISCCMLWVSCIPSISQPFADLTQGRALEQSLSMLGFAKTTTCLGGGGSLVCSLTGPSLRERVQDGPGVLQSDAPCRERGQSRLCTLGPAGLRPGWGLCRLCNLLPAPGATRASLAQNSLVQGVGYVGMAGGLGMPSFSCSSSSSGNYHPAVLALTQRTPGAWGSFTGRGAAATGPETGAGL